MLTPLGDPVRRLIHDMFWPEIQWPLEKQSREQLGGVCRRLHISKDLQPPTYIQIIQFQRELETALEERTQP